MQIQIQSLHFDAGTALQQETNEKLIKLDKIYDRIESAQVTLKKEHSTNNNDCIVEVRLAIPKDDLFAKEAAGTFAQALSQVVEDLKKQLLKRKDKTHNFDRVKSTDGLEPIEEEAETEIE